MSTEARLCRLEEIQAFQEDEIEALKKTVTQQHREIQTLNKKLKLLSEYLKTLREEGIRDPNLEVPPPHY